MVKKLCGKVVEAGDMVKKLCCVERWWRQEIW